MVLETHWVHSVPVAVLTNAGVIETRLPVQVGPIPENRRVNKHVRYAYWHLLLE
jgi:hypothetical protein